MFTCKEKSRLSPLVAMIKEKMQIKSLDKVIKELNAVEYDMYYVGWECDSKFWLLEDGLMITTDHHQVVEFTQEDYKIYKRNLQKYIFNLPSHIKPTAKVVIDGYESALDSIVDARQRQVSFRKNSSWWDGIYKESNKDMEVVYLKSTRRMGE